VRNGGKPLDGFPVTRSLPEKFLPLVPLSMNGAELPDASVGREFGTTQGKRLCPNDTLLKGSHASPRPVTSQRLGGKKRGPPSFLDPLGPALHQPLTENGQIGGPGRRRGGTYWWGPSGQRNIWFYLGLTRAP